jgi:alkylhydroperoxidase family enzyme
VGDLDEVLALTPAAEAFRRFRDAVWADTFSDPRLLELCRLRMAQILGRDATSMPRHPEAVSMGLDDGQVLALGAWLSSPLFSARDRAVLAFAEQVLIDPHGVTDDDCKLVRTYLTDPECAALTMGLALIEAILRVELVLGADEQPPRLDDKEQP